MGCDIHLYTEYQNKEGIWTTGDIWEPSKYGEGLVVPGRFRAYDSRNYNFFAWLANVRNQTWGEYITPISEPKGIPENCCSEIKEMIKQWEGDGHSHSFFTFKELEDAYEKMREDKIEFNGAVNPSNPNPKFQTWLQQKPEERGAPPDGYCAAGTHCIPMKWVETLEELLKWPWNELRDFLWNLQWDKNITSDKVRIVFFFDN